MHKSNLPSIISSSSNEVIQSCLIYNEIVFLGLRNGFIEIFEYKTNTILTDITNLFINEEKKTEKELKFNPHSNQIISIQLIKELQTDNNNYKDLLIYIQSRGGLIFIIKYDISNKRYKLLLKYDTKIETFTEFCLSNKIYRTEWENQIKNISNSENIYKIFVPLEKDNEIDILLYTDNYNDNNESCSIDKINQNFDYIIDEDGQKILDVYKDMESKIFQIGILAKNTINNNSSKHINDIVDNYLVMVFEKTLIFILDEKMNYVSHYSLTFSLKLYESMINIYSFKFKNYYFICIGLFAKDLILLKFDGEKLFLYEIIKNICPEIKYGISCFTYGVVKTNDLFVDEELIKNKFLLFVGTYSKRVKIFEIIDYIDDENKEKENKIINDKNIKFNDLGNLIVDNSGAINQIHFSEGNLFVVCDRKILYIYSI